jgi:hypothetical protein
MGSGTITLRVLKPDPMPRADGRDAHPYMARMLFAGGLGFAVGGLMKRTSGDAGPYLEAESAGRPSLPQDGNGHCSKAQGGRSSM